MQRLLKDKIQVASYAEPVVCCDYLDVRALEMKTATRRVHPLA